MLVCGECGAANQEGEDFCGECGAYLDWDAEHVAVEPEPVTVPAAAESEPAVPEQQPRRLVERMREAVGIGGGVGDGAPDDVKDAGTVAEPAAAGLSTGVTSDAPTARADTAAGSAGAPPEKAPAGASDGAAPGATKGEAAPAEAKAAAGTTSTDKEREHAAPTSKVAESLVVKVPPPGAAAATGQAGRAGSGKGSAPTTEQPSAKQPSAKQPGAVRPGAAAPKPRRRPPSQVKEPIEHGDLICGSCGAGNKPTRKFCRRCGHDLVDAVVAKVPWWRRIFRRGQKKKVAGTRPKVPKKRRRRPTKYLVMLVVLSLLAVAGWSFRDTVRGAYDVVADRVLGSEPFHPKMSASSSRQGAPASQANDGTSNLFWAPASANPRGQYLQADFEEPIRLTHLIVTAGVSTEEPRFLRNGRPRVLRLVVRDTDGQISRQRLRLRDEAGPQTFDVGYSNVERVRLVILSVRPGSAAGTPVGIVEVEYLGRS